MVNSIKVSIIIPIYNSQEFLDDCLVSVLRQTLKEIEIICINDGSTDNSLQILNQYQQKDHRIILHNQENYGAGFSRNQGISLAKGEFVIFMDSDDWYPNNNILELLYENAKAQQVNICGGSFSHYKNGKYYSNFTGDYSAYTFNEASLVNYNDYQFDYGFHRFMYNRNFLIENGIYFPKYRHFEDPPFFVKAMVSAQTFYALPDIVYCYRKGQKETKWTKDKVNDLLKGMIDNLTLSHLHQLSFLHTLTLKRINTEYCKIIVSQLNINNLELVQLLLDADKAIDRTLLNGFDVNDCKPVVVKPLEILFGKSLEIADRTLIATKQEVKNLESRVEQIFLSKSYKIGRFITFIPRKIRNMLHCLHDNGWKCTIMRMLFHLGIKKKIRIPYAATPRCLPKVYCDISIIIPVYNAAPYLKTCIESILGQTKQEFEIICVDDGSTDNSLELLRQYEQDYENITVITQNNQYAGVARNHGMQYAKGKYLLFVDADDFLSCNLLEETYKAAEGNDADLVIFGADQYDHQTQNLTPAPWLLKEHFVPVKKPFCFRDIPDHILNLSTGGPCNKLFKKALVDEFSLQFSPYRSTNDIVFVYNAFVLARRIVTVNKVLYHIRHNHGTNLSATKDRVPLLFYKGYTYLQQTLIERGVYDLIEKSFVNQALSGCIFEISSINDPVAHEEAEKLFCDMYRFQFHIAGKPESYFYLKAQYEAYKKILQNRGIEK